MDISNKNDFDNYLDMLLAASEEKVETFDDLDPRDQRVLFFTRMASRSSAEVVDVVTSILVEQEDAMDKGELLDLLYNLIHKEEFEAAMQGWYRGLIKEEVDAYLAEKRELDEDA